MDKPIEMDIEAANVIANGNASDLHQPQYAGKYAHWFTEQGGRLVLRPGVYELAVAYWVERNDGRGGLD